MMAATSGSGPDRGAVTHEAMAGYGGATTEIPDIRSNGHGALPP